MFEEIIGNEFAKTYLQKRLEMGLLSNTQLFAGPDGIGKSLFASEIAKHLTKSDKKQHPDIFHFHPDGLSFTHSIESIRYLKEQVYKPPFEAPAKVFILHEADKMLPSAANALLKTLEEPTLDSYLILLSSSEELLLPTILSRCSKVSFHPLKQEQMVCFMRDNWEIDDTSAAQIARLSEGSLEKAFLLCKEESFLKKKDILFSILKDRLIDERLDKLQALIDKDKKEGIFWKKHIDLLLSLIWMWQRDIHATDTPENLIFEDEISYLKQNKVLPLFQLEEVMEKVLLGLYRNIKVTTCLEALFLELF